MKRPLILKITSSFTSDTSCGNRIDENEDSEDFGRAQTFRRKKKSNQNEPVVFM